MNYFVKTKQIPINVKHSNSNVRNNIHNFKDFNYISHGLIVFFFYVLRFWVLSFCIKTDCHSPFIDLVEGFSTF